MCTRPENVNHVICTSQKRPLSIIAEQDGDDHDAINITKCQQATDNRGTDSKLIYQGIIRPRKEVKNDLTNQKLSKSKTSLKTINEQNKSSTKESKSRLIDTVFQEFISKSEINEINSNHNNSSSLNSKDEATKCSLPQTLKKKEKTSQDNISSLQKPEVLNFSDGRSCVTQSHNSVTICSPQETTPGDDNETVTGLLNSNQQDKERLFEETNKMSTVTPPQSSIPNTSKLANCFYTPTPSSTNTHDIEYSPINSAPQITLSSSEETQCLETVPISCIHNSDDIGNKISKLSTDVISCIIISEPCNNSSNSQTKRACPNSNMKPRGKAVTISSCRGNNSESTGALPDNGVFDASSNLGDIEQQEDSPALTFLSDFRKLKETTEKLHLSTRRPSTMLWKEQYVEGQGFPALRPGLNGDVKDERLTEERKQRIDDALEWLRTELQEMRSQDQNLARLLLTIRQDIHQLKLKRSTEEHQELIEEFQSELDDLQETSDVLDFPQTIYGNNPLKHIGVTRLNMNARRFSAC